MNKEATIELHANIFEIFITNRPDLVYLLKSSDHGINLHRPNPYHMEGDVWTHTVMAYNALLYIPQFMEMDVLKQTLACISVLCHDLGKPAKRCVNDVDRPRFIGHEKRSVVECMDLIGLFKELYSLDDNMIYFVLSIVSAHSEYWLKPSMQEVFPLLNYNVDVLEVYKAVTMADSMGQLTKANSTVKKNIYDFEFDLTLPAETDEDKQTVFIMVGPPACGKDTVIANQMFEYAPVSVSYDAIRLKVYREANGIVIDNLPNELTSNDIYKLAFDYCNNKKVNLDMYLYEEISEALIAGRNVVISNTNMSVKTRMKMIQRLRSLNIDVNIDFVLICTDIDELIQRDAKRCNDDKTVGESVIRRMMNNFELPTLAEGVDNLHVIIN